MNVPKEETQRRMIRQAQQLELWLPRVFLLCSVFFFLVLAAVHFWHYVNDDAYITFRYSLNLAEGHGPYYNPGEHVEGYTNFTYMLLAAAFIKAFGAETAPLLAKGFGLLCGAGTVVGVFFLTRLILDSSETQRQEVGRGVPAEPPPAANGSQRDETTRKFLDLDPAITQIALTCAVASLAVALNLAFALNSVSGLETALFAFCLTLGAWLGALELKKDRFHAAALPFAVAVLTRPEGCVIFGVWWIAQTLTGILMRKSEENPSSFPNPFLRLQLISGFTVTGVFALHLAFRYFAYDGEWLPNTYYAKVAEHSLSESWDYIKNGVLTTLFGPVGFLAGVLGLVLGKSRVSPLVIPILVTAVIASLIPLFTGPGWMAGWRLVMPYLPLMAVAVAAGWSCLLLRLLPNRSLLRVAALGLCIPGIMLAQSQIEKSLDEYIRIRAEGYKNGHWPLARWLKEELAPGDTIAVMDIGIIGYTCHEQRILDITGLTDRFIAKSPGPFLEKVYDPSYVFDQMPEAIVLTFKGYHTGEHPPPPDTKFWLWTPMEYALFEDPRFRQNYVSRRPGGAPENWPDTLLYRVGASRIHEHDHPQYYYILATFIRNDLKKQP